MILVQLESAFYALFNDTLDKAMACSQQKYELINVAILFTVMCVTCILLTPIYVIQIPNFR